MKLTSQYFADVLRSMSSHCRKLRNRRFGTIWNAIAIVGEQINGNNMYCNVTNKSATNPEIE